MAAETLLERPGGWKPVIFGPNMEKLLLWLPSL